MNKLDITIHKDLGIPTLKLTGRIDTLTEPSFRETLFKTIDQHNTSIVLDFSFFSYMSSIGFRTLIMAQKNLSPEGGQLILSGVSTYVKEVFDISGFTHLFCFTESNSDALQYIQQLNK